MRRLVLGGHTFDTTPFGTLLPLLSAFMRPDRFNIQRCAHVSATTTCSLRPSHSGPGKK